MQLPGLDELESAVSRAVEEIGRLKTENAELKERLRALGKEIDELGTQLRGVGSGQKLDSRKRKRIEQRLKSIAAKLA
jgi:FtsZ-binding cell division protein ZapB